MLFRKQRNMTVTFAREGWLRPDTPLPSGDRNVRVQAGAAGRPAEDKGQAPHMSLTVRALSRDLGSRFRDDCYFYAI